MIPYVSFPVTLSYKLKVAIPRNASREDLIKEIQTAEKFNRERLDDYYRFASASDYAPIYYRKVDGLTPEHRDFCSLGESVKQVVAFWRLHHELLHLNKS